MTNLKCWNLPAGTPVVFITRKGSRTETTLAGPAVFYEDSALSSRHSLHDTVKLSEGETAFELDSGWGENSGGVLITTVQGSAQ